MPAIGARHIASPIAICAADVAGIDVAAGAAGVARVVAGVATAAGTAGAAGAASIDGEASVDAAAFGAADAASVAAGAACFSRVFGLLIVIGFSKPICVSLCDYVLWIGGAFRGGQTPGRNEKNPVPKAHAATLPRIIPVRTEKPTSVKKCTRRYRRDRAMSAA